LNRLLLLAFLALPCLAGVKIVSDTTDVEIDKQTYEQAVLTYTFNQKEIVLYGFSINSIEKLKVKADTLTVDHKDKGEKKAKKWNKKIPVVKELKKDRP
jgi:ABC-type transport system involved in cytochrome bd biosynthesis fused ATPase/permease subunit